MLDLALDEDLKTVFTYNHADTGDQTKKLETRLEAWRSPYTHLSNSDGGAHTLFLTQSTWPIVSLSDLVRDKGIMTIEQAHYKMSGLPAQVVGLTDRGTLRVGMAADVMVYDLERLGFVHEKPVFDHDFPGGEPRLVQKPKGLRYILVNGVVTFVENDCSNALPGRMLRSCEMAER
jgi:N-acyl-D-aspartate/D-glutamate deacylase